MYLRPSEERSLGMALGRQLGVSYNTEHKLMQVMKERDESGRRHTCRWTAYLGGETRGGKRGRGAQGKTPFVAAVQVTEEAGRWRCG